MGTDSTGSPAFGTPIDAGEGSAATTTQLGVRRFSDFLVVVYALAVTVPESYRRGRHQQGGASKSEAT
jgi:hypothetical protein